VPRLQGSTLRTPGARRRAGLTAEAAKVLGTPVTVAVALQRRRPDTVLAASIAEIAGLAVLIATGRLAAMAVLVALSTILIVVAATNTRRVLVLTGKGNVVLAASLSGRPNGVIGPAPRRIELPEPTGLGVSVDVGGGKWWVDRSAFRALRRARSAQARLDEGA
jgi:hypothetical protein